MLPLAGPSWRRSLSSAPCFVEKAKHFLVHDIFDISSQPRSSQSSPSSIEDFSVEQRRPNGASNTPSGLRRIAEPLQDQVGSRLRRRIHRGKLWCPFPPRLIDDLVVTSGWRCGRSWPCVTRFGCDEKRRLGFVRLSNSAADGVDDHVGSQTLSDCSVSMFERTRSLFGGMLSLSFQICYSCQSRVAPRWWLCQWYLHLVLRALDIRHVCATAEEVKETLGESVGAMKERLRFCNCLSVTCASLRNVPGPGCGFPGG